MNKELIIRSGSNNIDFALLKDGKLVEFQKDDENFHSKRILKKMV